MSDEERFEAQRAELEATREKLPRMEQAVSRLLAEHMAALPAALRELVPDGLPEDKLKWVLTARKRFGTAAEAPKLPDPGRRLRDTLYGPEAPAPKRPEPPANGFMAIYRNTQARR